MKKIEIRTRDYEFTKEKIVASFEMGASNHKYNGCELDFEKNSQFYYKGEWYLVVYEYHSQKNVIIPCNVYAKYTDLINRNNAVFNADFILIDGKPLPQYNGRLKAAFAIC